jgi:phenylpropionate dioxygenase-like ring-hydroxylating dioxygenase large terminal subunit
MVSSLPLRGSKIDPQGSSPVPPDVNGLPERFLLTADHLHQSSMDPDRASRRSFAATWLYVGDGDRLQPGMVWARSVAGAPLLIVRDNEGELRAFYNLCPHRAAILSPQAGIHPCQKLVCPYHAWVYDLSGDLVGVPSQNQFSESFEKQNFPCDRCG